MDDKQQFNSKYDNNGMPVEPIPEGVAVPLPDDEPPKPRGRRPWTKFAVIMLIMGVVMFIMGHAAGGRSVAVVHSGGLFFNFIPIGNVTFGGVAASQEFVSLTHADAHAISTVIVDTTFANVVVERGSGDRVGRGFGVSFANIESHSMNINGETLTISTRNENNRNQMILFGTNIQPSEIRIQLPDVLQDLAVTTTSGSIRLYDMNPDLVRLNASSGSIRINEVRSTAIMAMASSGSIRLVEVRAEQVAAHANSGSIRIEDVFFTDGDIQTTSGSITIEDSSWEILNARSTSGSIRASDVVIRHNEIRSHAEPVTALRSTSGSVNLSIDGRRADFSYEARATSGSIHVDGRRVGGGNMDRHITGGSGSLLLSLQSTSGSVHLRFDD